MSFMNQVTIGKVNQISKQVSDNATSLSDNMQNLSDRGINVMHPPVPLVAAKGDNSTDDRQVIQNIVNSFGSTGGTVFFPNAKFKVSNNINVPNNVNLIGAKGATLVRYFNYSVAYSVLTLTGNNVVENISIDGGLDHITVTSGDYTNYTDVFMTGNNVSIRKCKFFNACGSFIVGSYQNVIISDNEFGDYRDHAIYVAGNLDAVQPQDYSISNNRFIASSTPNRECIKLRNNINKVNIHDNIVELPSAAFITIETGTYTGATNTILPNGLISISGNMGSCNYFVQSLSATVSAGKIHIVDNQINCTSYMFLFGAFPIDASTQNGTIIDELVIRNNTIVSVGAGILNGMLSTTGITNFECTDNSFIMQSSTLFTIFGEVTNQVFDNNTFSTSASASSSNTIVDLATSNSLAYTFKGSTVGLMLFKDNQIKAGYQTMLYENSTGKTATLLHWTVFADENKSLTSFEPVNCFGDHQADITQKLYTKNNFTTGTLYNCSWSTNNWISKDSKQELQFTVTTSNVSVGTLSSNYTEVLDSRITGNERIIANPQYGSLPAGVFYYAYALGGKFRVYFYNTTAASVTVNLSWLVTVKM